MDVGEAYMEIERKYAVIQLPNLKEFKKEKIEQLYLSIEPEVRIRNKGSKLTLTIKSDGKLSRLEVEKELTPEEYDALKEISVKEVMKTRYTKAHFIKGKEYIFELDIYDNIEGLVTVEVEFDNENDANNFEKPSWFGDELTHLDKYKNKNLAKMRWTKDAQRNKNV